MKLKDFFDNPFEIFWWAASQFPIVLYVGWWVFPIMVISGLLGRLGGTEGGSKLARRIGDPLMVCGATFLKFNHFGIFLAVPFMVWFAPSYGKESWLFKVMVRCYGKEKADLPTRVLLLFWYWTAFILALLLRW
jgi:hypothetical protein